MNESLYRIYGLSIRSDLVLSSDRMVQGIPDLAIVGTPGGEVSDDPPPGRMIAKAWTDERRYYSGATGPDGTVMRFHGLCEFTISADGKDITWRPAPDTGEELVSLLLSGTVLATYLMLAGHLVLHASAVRVGGSALGFVAASGMGKSTLAAVLCRRPGTCLVADDVLRVEGDRCFTGTGEARLRPHAVSVLEGRNIPSRTTADGRLAVALPPVSEDSHPLQALIVPLVDRECPAVVAQRLSVRDAVLALSGFPRILGWEDPDAARRQFEGIVDTATSIPVWTCRIPWGPPYRESLADDILNAIGWQDS